MQDARFFKTTRGKIVTALRRRRSASAVDLAGDFGLSANAVRQQLMTLERDGYVAEQSVRRGPTKPTLEYSLTERAETLFPQRYDRMLNAVLRSVRTEFGAPGLDAVLGTLGRREAERYRTKLQATDVLGRATELASLLREQGVRADVVETPSGAIELREHTCPYAKTVAEHPEVCTLIHHVLHETVSTDVRQVESLATGGESCRFEVASGRPSESSS